MGIALFQTNGKSCTLSQREMDILRKYKNYVQSRKHERALFIIQQPILGYDGRFDFRRLMTVKDVASNVKGMAEIHDQMIEKYTSLEALDSKFKLSKIVEGDGRNIGVYLGSPFYSVMLTRILISQVSLREPKELLEFIMSLLKGSDSTSREWFSTKSFGSPTTTEEWAEFENFEKSNYTQIHVTHKYKEWPPSLSNQIIFMFHLAFAKAFNIELFIHNNIQTFYENSSVCEFGLYVMKVEKAYHASKTPDADLFIIENSKMIGELVKGVENKSHFTTKYIKNRSLTKLDDIRKNLQ